MLEGGEVMGKLEMGFVIPSESWYKAVVGDSLKIFIGDYPEEGGTKGEFTIIWVPSGSKLVPKLHSYDDSWRVLSRIPEFFTKLGELDDKNASIHDIKEMLLSLGYKDMTEYSRVEK